MPDRVFILLNRQVAFFLKHFNENNSVRTSLNMIKAQLDYKKETIRKKTVFKFDALYLVEAHKANLKFKDSTSV